MFGVKTGLKVLEKEVQYYESLPVEKGKILLYGDSTFTRCSSICCEQFGNPDIEKEILKKDGTRAIVNHGIGGSCADQQLYYYDRLVRPYEPSALVLSSCGNDFDHAYSPIEIVELISRIVDYAQTDFPGIQIYICSSTPAPREIRPNNSFIPFSNNYNELLDVYCAGKSGVKCLRMQDMPFLFKNPEEAGGYKIENGVPVNNLREDVRYEDGGHFNVLGYKYFIEYLREQFAPLL